MDLDTYTPHGYRENRRSCAETEAKYVPAARWRVFTRVYDPVIAMTMRERRWRELMAERVSADLPEGGVAVDLGCGTGTFAIGLAARRPDAELIGVDGDAEILDLARRKPGAAGVEWRQGLAQELPVADASADVLTTSLVLHHLLPDDKRAALAEARPRAQARRPPPRRRLGQAA